MFNKDNNLDFKVLSSIVRNLTSLVFWREGKPIKEGIRIIPKHLDNKILKGKIYNYLAHIAKVDPYFNNLLRSMPIEMLRKLDDVVLNTFNMIIPLSFQTIKSISELPKNYFIALQEPSITIKSMNIPEGYKFLLDEDYKNKRISFDERGFIIKLYDLDNNIISKPLVDNAYKSLKDIFDRDKVKKYLVERILFNERKNLLSNNLIVPRF